MYEPKARIDDVKITFSSDISTALETYNAIGRAIRIYLWFDGCEDDDQLLLFNGIINNTSEYGDSTRTIDFDCIDLTESKHRDFYVPIISDDFTDAPPESLNKQIPLYYGAIGNGRCVALRCKEATGDYRYIFTLGNASNNISNVKNQAGTDYTSSMVSDVEGKWYHIVLTWDTSSNNVTGYLDGDEVFDETHDKWPTTMPEFVIGTGITSRYWKGYIDDLRIYSAELSQENVSTIYNSGDGTENSLGSPSETYHWKMNEASWNGTANEVVDSADSKHGTAVNGATTTSSGKISRAGTFDGTNDYVSIGNLGSFPAQGSIAFWVYMIDRPSSFYDTLSTNRTANTINVLRFEFISSGQYYVVIGDATGAYSPLHYYATTTNLGTLSNGMQYTYGKWSADLTTGLGGGIDPIITFNCAGIKDDGSGTYTGTPYAVITKPTHVIKHFLCYFMGWEIVDIDDTSFSNIQDYLDSLAFPHSTYQCGITEIRNTRDILLDLAYQCFCRLYYDGSLWKIAMPAESDLSVHHIEDKNIQDGSWNIEPFDSGYFSNDIIVKYKEYFYEDIDERLKLYQHYENSESIGEIGLKTITLDAWCISDDDMSMNILNYLADLHDNKYQAYSMVTDLRSLAIEINDTIDFSHSIREIDSQKIIVERTCIKIGIDNGAFTIELTGCIFPDIDALFEVHAVNLHGNYFENWNPIADSDVVAQYVFNDNVGATLDDESLNGNDLTLAGETIDTRIHRQSGRYTGDYALYFPSLIIVNQVNIENPYFNTWISQDAPIQNNEFRNWTLGSVSTATLLPSADGLELWAGRMPLFANYILIRDPSISNYIYMQYLHPLGFPHLRNSCHKDPLSIAKTSLISNVKITALVYSNRAPKNYCLEYSRQGETDWQSQYLTCTTAEEWQYGTIDLGNSPWTGLAFSWEEIQNMYLAVYYKPDGGDHFRCAYLKMTFDHRSAACDNWSNIPGYANTVQRCCYDNDKYNLWIYAVADGDGSGVYQNMSLNSVGWYSLSYTIKVTSGTARISLIDTSDESVIATYTQSLTAGYQEISQDAIKITALSIKIQIKIDGISETSFYVSDINLDGYDRPSSWEVINDDDIYLNQETIGSDHKLKIYASSSGDGKGIYQDVTVTSEKDHILQYESRVNAGTAILSVLNSDGKILASRTHTVDANYRTFILPFISDGTTARIQYEIEGDTETTAYLDTVSLYKQPYSFLKSSPAGMNFGPCGDFSIDLWHKTGNMLCTQEICGRYTFDPTTQKITGWRLTIRGSSEASSASKARLELGDGTNTATLTSTSTLTTNTWYYIAVTVDRDGTSTMYLNSTASGTADLSSVGDLGDSADFKIATGLAQAEYLSFLRISDKVRSVQEIKEAYECPEYWNYQSSDDYGVASRSSSMVQQGYQSLKITAGAANRGVQQSLSDLDITMWNIVRFYIYVTSGSAKIQVDAGSTYSTTIGINTGYEKKQLMFQPSATSGTIKLISSGAAATFYIDSIS
jgi:hypothetical protein